MWLLWKGRSVFGVDGVDVRNCGGGKLVLIKKRGEIRHVRLERDESRALWPIGRFSSEKVRCGIMTLSVRDECCCCFEQLLLDQG